MARLRKERVRARLSHTPFDYPIRPYRMSLADYFVRGSKVLPRLEEIDSVVHTDRETELHDSCPIGVSADLYSAGAP